MEENISLCVPLLERLKVLEDEQKNSKLKFDKFMVNMKNSNAPSYIEAIPDEMNLSYKIELQHGPETQLPTTNIAISPFSTFPLANELRSLTDPENSSDIHIERCNESPVRVFSNDAKDTKGLKEIENNGSHESKPIRPFLKKGQGLQRYGMKKKLKGFRNKNAGDKVIEESSAVATVRNEKLNTVAEGKRPIMASNEKKLSTFEELEDLVEHESFCSNSSVVQNLLNRDVSIGLSPLSRQSSSCSANKCDSPLRLKRTLEFHSALQLHNKDELIYENKRFLGISGDISSCTNTPSGILKTFSPIRTSPFTHNVKFCERGAEVLEFENPDHSIDNNSQIGDNDDSDLISISDLEQVALMRCKDKIYRSILDSANGREHSNNTPEKSNFRVPGNLENSTRANEEIEAHKILLLSKVNDLKNEIEVYKKMNQEHENLIQELNLEKESLTKQHNDMKTKGTKLDNFRQQVSANVASKNLKAVNDQLKKFENENMLLKNKIKELENNEIRNRNHLMALQAKLKNLDNNSSKPNEDRNPQLSKNENKKNGRFKQSQGKNINRNKVEGFDRKFPQASNKNILKNAKTKRSDPIPLATSHQNNSTNQEKLLTNEAVFPETNTANCNPNAAEQRKIHFKGTSSIQVPPVLNFPFFSANHEGSSKHCINLSPVNLIANNAVPRIAQNFSKENNAIPIFHCADASLGDTIDIIDIAQPVKQFEQLSNATGMQQSIGIQKENINKQSENKIIDSDGKITCYYAKEKITKVIYKDDGREEINFPNGQREIYFKDGSYQVLLSNGSSKSFYADGSTVSVCPNGTVVRKTSTGEKTVQFPNGQKEVYNTDSSVSRVYPNGTVKTLFANGNLETRYPSGLVRLKDKEGNVICSL